MASCSVKGCQKNTKSKHRFPNPTKNKALFDKWVNLIGNARLLSEEPEKIYNNRRVCSLHFEPHNFGPNSVLKKGTLPSINLPNPLKQLKDSPETSKKVTSLEDESPRSKKLTSMLQSQFDKLRAKKRIYEGDYAIPSTSKTPSICHTHEEVPEQLDSLSSDVTISATKPSCSNVSIIETPLRKRSVLLSEVNVSMVKDLTPKAKHLYRRAVQFKKRIALSKKRKLSLKKRLLQKFDKSEVFEKCVSMMDHVRARFFQSQIENASKKPKGRRYTLEDKVLALALYKQSGTGYRLLSKLFALPSRKTVMKLLNRIPINPGLHNEVFSVLKAEVKQFKNPLDKYCVLIFDEMSIQPNLQPNFNEGRVVGFEDFGFKQTQEIANHTQVFMLRGIRRKWKQPVYFNFVNGATKKDDLVQIIKLIIRKCKSIGLNIVATVCDQGTNNQAAIKRLVEETGEKYKRQGSQFYDFHFEVDEDKIIPLFDVPHLFKGLRNNFLNYNIKFMDGSITKMAKWSDIFTAYRIDPYLGSLRLMPKITDAHVNPEKINKMKVSRCTQVFSHTVAAAINVFAFSGTTVTIEKQCMKLDPSAADTAALLEFLDDLFDSLNGSSFTSDPGKRFRVAVTRSSPHEEFWKAAIMKLRSFKFIKNGREFIPPSLKNLLKTISNFQALWKELHNIGFTCLMPRTFNQDPLENFFGRIRQRGQRNVNPTPTDFGHYYKSLIISHLTSSQSVGANCEDDNSEVLLTLQRFVTQGLPEDDKEMTQEEFIIPESLPESLKPIEAKALKYVSGYSVKRIGKQPCDCKNLFLKRDQDDHDEEFIKAKEYIKGKQSLTYVNTEFLGKLKYALAIIKYIFNRYLYSRSLVKSTMKILLSKITLTSCLHDTKIKRDVFKYLIKLKLFNYATQLNRIMRGLDLRPIPTNASKIFLSAKKIHLKSSKKKKYC